MKYFIDTEFIEGFKKPLFGKRRHFIDLISIGIYAEDGREYHAISNEYNYNDADDWVKDNVILPMYISILGGDMRDRYDSSTFHKRYGKPNKQIANEIFQFICPYDKASEYAGVGSIDDGATGYLKTNPPEFYGYYSDYDWVLFCSLFGRMIDLPKGFPMYCRDLKQMLDEKAELHLAVGYGSHTQGNKHYPKDFSEALENMKGRYGYPKQDNEHNALADAKWNYEMFKFLQKMQ